MRTVGVIPARWGSTRFPGKSLHPICGRPLVVWVAEAVRRAAGLDEVIVATDDARIAAAVRDTGVSVVMTHPDLPSGTDRVAAAAQPEDDDIIVNIQGDEPLIDPGLIEALAVRLRTDAAYQMATAACPIRTSRELEARTVVKVVCDADGGALYFSRLPIPCRRDGDPDLQSDLYLRHVGIYAYRGAFIKRLVQEPPCALERAESLEQLRALYIGGRIAVLRTAHSGCGVDIPEDVGIVEAEMRKRGIA
jgi:3-deoxy-manno-octulosonate cytidylyltransferase (CMP-KDO synthetase)